MRKKIQFGAFSDLDRKSINRELQTHTSWTDGKGTINEMLQAAQDRNIKDYAFTEHARAESDYYPSFFKEIDAAKLNFPNFNIYRGFEVKIIDRGGDLDISDDMRRAADLVLGSVHSFPGPDGTRINPALLKPEIAQRLEFEMASAMVRSKGADVLSHPGGMSLRNFGAFANDYFEDLMRICKDSGMAFEINYSYHAPVLDDLIAMLERIDPLISIGSDAHHPDTVGVCRDALMAKLKL